MKIGIMTYWWSQCNYGQVLQAFALQKFLQQLGHDAYTIRYNHCRERKTVAFVCRNYKDIIGRRVRKLLGLSPLVVDAENESVRGFDRFRAENMKFSGQEYGSIGELRANPPKADVYICGSDQIWNPNLWGNPYLNHAYFLDFGSVETKRIAYAASMGIPVFPRMMRDAISRMLERFSSIAVREEKSVSALSGLYNKPVHVAIDPTLLLDRLVYDRLADKSHKKFPAKYCFVYLIGTISLLPVDAIKRFAAEHDLEVVYCGSGSRSEFPNHKLTIEEWLAAMRGAHYVVTNSFHGTVFSILFARQFANVAISKSVASLSDRVTGLLQALGLDQRYCSSESDMPEQHVDYEPVLKKLQNLQLSARRELTL